MIITVGGIKGGTGKTTIATNLAIWLSQRQNEVLLVDTDDRQKTAMDYTTVREELKGEGKAGYTAIHLQGTTVSSQVNKLKDKFSHVIIDCGVGDTNSQRHALLICDLYLIPMPPRSWDLWTWELIQANVEQAKSSRMSDFKAYSFINFGWPVGKDNQLTGEALSEYKGIEFVPASIVTRKAISNAGALGLSVLEQQDSKAKFELTNLFNYIIKK